MRKLLLQLTFLGLLAGCQHTTSPRIIENNEAYSLINDFIIDSLRPINLFAIETIKYWNVDRFPEGPPKGAPFYISYSCWLLDSLIKYNIIDPSERNLVIKQLEENEEYDWDSSKIKLRTFSLKAIEELKTDDPKDGPWDKIGKIYHTNEFIIMSTPIFLMGKDAILISVNKMCNGLCGNGKFIVMKKIKGKWITVFNEFTWTS